MKRQVPDKENICKPPICHKDETISNLQILTVNISNNPNNKWAKDMNRHLTEDNIQMSNKLVRRCSTSLDIRKMQISINEISIPIFRMSIIKKTVTKFW